MSPKLRAIIYALVIGALAVLVAFGLITGAQEQAAIAVLGAVLNLAAAVAAMIATRHVTEDSWSVFRSAVFATTSALLALAGVSGLILPDTLVMERTTAILNAVGLVVLAIAAGKVPDGVPAETATYDPDHDIEPT